MLLDQLPSPTDELSISVTPAEPKASLPPPEPPITPLAGWLLILEAGEEELKSAGGIILVSEQKQHAGKLGSHWRLGRIVRAGDVKLNQDGTPDQFDRQRAMAIPKGALVFYDYRAAGQIVHRGTEWTLCPRDRTHGVMDEPPKVTPAV